MEPAIATGLAPEIAPADIYRTVLEGLVGLVELLLKRLAELHDYPSDTIERVFAGLDLALRSIEAVVLAAESARNSLRARWDFPIVGAFQNPVV